MSAVAKPKYLTPEEYLAIERKADYKSEYIDGVMYSMAGGSEEHNLMSGNVFAELHAQLKDKPCKVYTENMKVGVPSTRKFHYPDVTLVSGEAKFADDEKDVLLNPVILVEVLSDSTESYDRRKKFLYYQEIESFQEYLLIAQDAPIIQHYVRQSNNSWLCTKIEGLDQSVSLTTFNCHLEFKDIYAKVLT